LVSACPTLDLLAAGRLVLSSRRSERAGWPTVEVVDRRADDPRSGLFSERLVELVRWATAGDDRRVLCVLNRTGRARLMACTSCGELARCSRCRAAVGQGTKEGQAGMLVCRRCGAERPEICDHCSSTRLRTLRVGVSRVREELEALAGGPVAEVSAQDHVTSIEESVVVGTEAVLHRVERADAVAFLDFDAELLAPRLRAGEQALALLARAASVVAGTGRDPTTATRAPGRVVVQTRQPQHPALVAAVSADPGILADVEAPLRAELRLPPMTAQALVSGPAAELYGPALSEAALGAGTRIEVLGPTDGVWSVVAPDHASLSNLLADVPRPSGRLRVEVDPVRW
jgi:primosomal protein N' (replication factor Y)